MSSAICDLIADPVSGVVGQPSSYSQTWWSINELNTMPSCRKSGFLQLQPNHMINWWIDQVTELWEEDVIEAGIQQNTRWVPQLNYGLLPCHFTSRIGHGMSNSVTILQPNLMVNQWIDQEMERTLRHCRFDSWFSKWNEGAAVHALVEELTRYFVIFQLWQHHLTT